MKIRKRLSPRTANQRVARLDDGIRLQRLPKGGLIRGMWGRWSGERYVYDTVTENQRIRRVVRRLEAAELGLVPGLTWWQRARVNKKILARARARLRRKRRQA